MLDLYKQSLQGQYEAALSTMRDCLAQCPDEYWGTNVGNYPFWQAAYHALYYTDLYLSQNEASFEPPLWYRANYDDFATTPDGKPVVPDEPYDRATLLKHVDRCRRKAATSLAAETEESLAGECGFSWYSINRCEFHVNNVRHLHHHAAQLSLFLRNTANIGIRWMQSGWRD